MSNMCVIRFIMRIKSKNIPDKDIKNIPDYFFETDNFMTQNERDEIDQEIIKHDSIIVYSRAGNIIDALNAVSNSNSVVAVSPISYDIQIIDNRLHEHFHEFISNPFINITNQSTLDIDFLEKVFNLDKSIFKLPMMVLFNIKNDVSIIKTHTGERVIPKQKEELLESSNVNGIVTTFNKIYTYGNGGSKTTVKKVVSNEETQQLIKTEVTVIDNNSGEIIEQNSIDYSKASIHINNKPEYIGGIGYKACVGPNHEHCIVKLFIYPDSYVATDIAMKKFRTNRCKVLDIAVVHNRKIIRDFRYECCTKCHVNPAVKIALPCKHKYCINCVVNMLDTTCTDPKCKKEIISTGNIILDTSSDKPLFSDIRIAYSFITNVMQQYEIGTDVVINDFDTDLEKRCSKGVHYHVDINEVHQWFEYLNIPEELKEMSYADLNVFDLQPNVFIGGQISDTLQSDQMKFHNKFKKADNNNPNSSIITSEMANADGLRRRK